VSRKLYADPVDLQQEAADVLSRLIQFNTVNPPGAERELQEWLKAYLEEAGLECELYSPEPDRPNLVATLKGAEPGPVLGYLSHVDTVLATAEDWTHGPWSGDVADGHLWGRGALDMKNQTAAEVVAAASLARSGWRPARGELKVIVVVDEETGGELGAQWLTENHPEAARVDFLLNEGAGAVIPYGDRRLYGVCCAEKGTFRFRVRTRGVAGHASIPGVGDNALVKLAPVLERLAAARPAYDVTPEPRAFLEAVGGSPDPETALAAIRDTDPRLHAMVEPAVSVTMAPTRIFGSEKINVIPAVADLHVDCRVPPGLGATEAMARIREALGDAADGVEIDWLEQVVGNRSDAASELFDAIAEWIGSEDAAGEVVPFVLPAFTDSRHWRDAFPDCVAYGFFPMRHQDLYATWPLIHGADERIDLRDLAWATAFYAWLPKRMLG
jgi:acetylornithine deacetylase/succinyl-diaminopimelate desuccinylase-like protein